MRIAREAHCDLQRVLPASAPTAPVGLARLCPPIRCTTLRYAAKRGRLLRVNGWAINSNAVFPFALSRPRLLQGPYRRAHQRFWNWRAKPRGASCDSPSTRREPGSGRRASPLSQRDCRFSLQQPLDTAPEKTGPTRGERVSALFLQAANPFIPSSRVLFAAYRGTPLFIDSSQIGWPRVRGGSDAVSLIRV